MDDRVERLIEVMGNGAFYGNAQDHVRRVATLFRTYPARYAVTVWRSAYWGEVAECVFAADLSPYEPKDHEAIEFALALLRDDGDSGC